ncbi:hypothetical protein Tco_0032214 [Tanacetum coccineum]
MVVMEYHECDQEEWLEEHPKCYQAKGSKDDEKLVHLKMVVKFKVLIEKKKMCSLGLMRFDWWMWFLMVHLEELEMKKLRVRGRSFGGIHGRISEEDENGKKNEKDGLFNLKASDQSGKA